MKSGNQVIVIMIMIMVLIPTGYFNLKDKQSLETILSYLESIFFNLNCNKVEICMKVIYELYNK